MIKIDLCIRKTDPLFLYFVLQIDGIMMAVQNVNKIVKILYRMGPDAKDIVQVSERPRASLDICLLPFSRIDVSIGRSELLSHGHQGHFPGPLR